MKLEIKVLTAEDARNSFINIFKSSIIPKREGADKLLQWIESTDFFRAPASTRFHGAFEGGLCNHSLAVYESLKFINESWGLDLGEDSIALCALCHDLCKCNVYKVSTRNVKNERTGQWEKVPFYQFDDPGPYGFHGPKSVTRIQEFLHLSYDESRAIACHMGFGDQKNMNDVSSVYEKSPLAWALHVADEAATWRSKI